MFFDFRQQCDNSRINYRDLSKNVIYVVEVDAFKNLTNLRRLDLSKNKIISIGEGCFNGLANLERL